MRCAVPTIVDRDCELELSIRKKRWTSGKNECTHVHRENYFNFYNLGDIPAPLPLEFLLIPTPSSSGNSPTYGDQSSSIPWVNSHFHYPRCSAQTFVRQSTLVPHAHSPAKNSLALLIRIGPLNDTKFNFHMSPLTFAPNKA